MFKTEILGNSRKACYLEIWVYTPEQPDKRLRSSGSWGMEGRGTLGGEIGPEITFLITSFKYYLAF